MTLFFRVTTVDGPVAVDAGSILPNGPWLWSVDRERVGQLRTQVCTGLYTGVPPNVSHGDCSHLVEYRSQYVPWYTSSTSTTRRSCQCWHYSRCQNHSILPLSPSINPYSLSCGKSLPKNCVTDTAYYVAVRNLPIQEHVFTCLTLSTD